MHSRQKKKGFWTIKHKMIPLLLFGDPGSEVGTYRKWKPILSVIKKNRQVFAQGEHHLKKGMKSEKPRLRVRCALAETKVS